MRSLFGYFNILLVLIAISTIVTVLILSRSIDSNVSVATISSFQRRDDLIQIFEKTSDSSNKKPIIQHNPNIIKTIQCNLPNEKRIKCLLQHDRKLYVPFDFIARKFDMNENLTISTDENSLDHSLAFSYSESHSPAISYNSSGEFLWFSEVDVEERARVKSVSLIHGVPISSQWKPSGHIYPIQVCQYGLSYFSKWTQSNRGIRRINQEPNHFLIKGKSKFVYHENKKTPHFNTTKDGFEFDFTEKAIYKTNYSKDMRYLVANLATNSSFEITVDIMLRDSSLVSGNFIVRLIYKVGANSTDDKIKKNEALETRVDSDQINYVIYSINGLGAAQLFVRNMCLDVCKGLRLKCNKCTKNINELRAIDNDFKNSRQIKSVYYKIYQISLKGQGSIRNGMFLDQMNAPYFEMATQAVDYLIKHQSKSTGGWPASVVRKFDKVTRTFLKSNWLSAMAQGHAISLLSRFYAVSKQEKYILSAAQGLRPFELSVTEGGVRSQFMNFSGLVWYEEYPTQPYSLHVLNGFLYSLFGIYDFLSVCMFDEILEKNSLVQIYFEKALVLYANGLRSLNRMLGMFDTGMRSFYDLRHLESGGRANPNVARWDYHMLHVSLLSYLIDTLENGDLVARKFNASMVVDVEMLRAVRDRWRMYSLGVWNQNSQIKN